MWECLAHTMVLALLMLPQHISLSSCLQGAGPASLSYPALSLSGAWGRQQLLLSNTWPVLCSVATQLTTGSAHTPGRSLGADWVFQSELVLPLAYIRVEAGVLSDAGEMPWLVL